MSSEPSAPSDADNSNSALNPEPAPSPARQALHDWANRVQEVEPDEAASEPASEPAPESPPPQHDGDHDYGVLVAAAAPADPDGRPSIESGPSDSGPTDRADRPGRLPGVLYALLGLQLILTGLIAVALYLVWTGTTPGDLLAPWRAPAVEQLRPLESPQLDLISGAILVREPAPRLTGSAPFGDYVALTDGDTLVSLAPVEQGRFELPPVAFANGDHLLRLTAYDRNGRAVRSPTIRVLVVEQAPVAPPPGPSGASQSTRSRAGRNILRGSRQQHIALTFDGGSNANHAQQVLTTLRAKGVTATLFLTGEFIDRYPELTRQIVADGHEVGNHTLSHPHLADWVGDRHVTRATVSRDFLVGELRETERRFLRVAGRPMTRYWRAPYGEVNGQILGWAEQEGWTHVGWTQGLDTLDWVADPNSGLYRTAGEIRDRILGLARAGEQARGGIVLMHLGGDRETDEAADELPGIIDGLRASGYRLVTVSSLTAG